MKKDLNVRINLLVCCLWLASSLWAGPKLQRVFTVFNAANGLADNSAQTIKCTKTGRMVITTIGHINFYDGEKFNHIDPTNDNLFPLPKYNGHYHLYFDKHHHIWLKDKYTVTCLDLLTEKFIVNVDSVFKKLGMKRQVDDLFTTGNNRLWLLSGNKLYGIDDKRTINVQQHSDLHDVDVYNDKVLLQFFANGTVSGYDLQTGKYLFDVAAGKETAAVSLAKSSVILPDSNVFYQIRNGDKNAVLLKFDVETRKWSKLMDTPYHLNNMVLERGKLYIASEYGYWTYDVRTGDIEYQEELILKGGRRLKTDINVICFDRQGSMWIGTEKRGLLYSPRYKSPFVAYTWDQPEAAYCLRMIDEELAKHPHVTLPRHVNCEYRDSRGWTWTGSYTGLVLKKSADEPTVTFGRKDGLLNEMVHSIIEDKNHDIWISTSFGISHLFIEDDSVKLVETYNQEDNVPSESFSNGRAVMLEDGTIVMQALDHIVAFHPSNFHTNQLKDFRLFPKLVRLMVNGHYIEPGAKLDGRVILERTITRIAEFAVNYNQNSISLVFSGLNYMRPVQTYYRVRVPGLYDEWRVHSHADGDGFVDGRGLLHLPMPGLSPGTYEVEVQASMSPDSWPVKPFKWIIHVEQPWWRSTGVYLLLGLLLLALLVGNIVYYNRNLRLRFVRNNHENDILKRLMSYVERCENMAAETLSPAFAMSEEQRGEDGNVDQAFEQVMMQLMPYIRQQGNRRVSMGELSTHVGLKMGELYELLSRNLYKGPRQLVVLMKVQEGARLLRETDLSVEDIAERCRFSSPNYFIAAFYHEHRQTPKDYRSSMAR